MSETATEPRRGGYPKTREDDARGCPPGQATLDGEAVGSKGGGGRIGQPPFIATDAMRKDVEAWVRVGCTAEDIATLITADHKVPCSRQTVDRHFKHELAVGRAKVKVAIAGSLVKDALSGNMTAKIFWLRTQGKWNTRTELTGADGGPIKTYDLSAFGLDEKRLLLGVIDQLLEQHGGGEADGDSAASQQPVTH